MAVLRITFKFSNLLSNENVATVRLFKLDLQTFTFKLRMFVRQKVYKCIVCSFFQV